MAHEPKTKHQRYESWLRKHYDFRYNTILNIIEYRPKNSKTYAPMTDYVLNSIVRFLDKQHNEAPSTAKVYEILKSDFTPKYHPIKQYFLDWAAKMPHHTGTRYIDALADTVQVHNHDTFRLSLTRWLVSAVAQVFVEEIKAHNPKAKDCQNQTCLVFTGLQGAFKTTWLDMLCPASLAEYLFTGKINLNLENKDVFIMLGEKFVINLDDQLRNLIKKDNETMKTLITQGKVSIRRPHAKFSENIQRLGSFVASINGEDFLSEDQNRRYLPFQIQAIDIATAQLIDMDGVWMDAYYLFKKGLDTHFADGCYRYWWTNDELNQHFKEEMQNFRYTHIETEMFHTHFEVPTDKDEPYTKLFTSTDVVNYLKNFTKENLSVRKIGELCKSLGAHQKGDPTRANLKCFILKQKI